ncbi:Na/Pi cotransporter family protein [Akkermansiaceae bacterium]|nr:Na/Pi cotransporter family protein [Akkermansiaceae bacterium]MDB4644116.1 Na/Pi cotransporter family protein [bacterium]MDB4272628.1 Na/Pi cotransporter family protein [Akkermansiaceae bacterium]MDB4333068.1 Na/Pi cotransporter family protein [Akkermansiaceae bacterium]MDB4411969.1 Na/Pi cotransporter family protein [Akkermansiaceae bacterium]
MVTALQILGALGIFLFGMKVMSEGVQKFAGARMRAALASITGNRFKGVLTGAFTTGLVQSSSATTVLVVSFVNVGLLTLTESIGVVMGANLGTTLTAWIVATVGKFSVAKIAIPIIGIGFPVFFIGKGRAKAFGEFLVGFGLLFLGLGELKDAVPDLKSGIGKMEDATAVDAIRHWISVIGGYGYLSYIFFMIGGIILTLIVQSSSAAMAITITCATQGWFSDDPYEAFRISAAVVLGENIGTTVTAWLASLGANTEAKRAARAHFLFNVIGTIWMLIVFIPFARLVWEVAQHLPEGMKSAKKEWGASEVAFATAIFHTMFNLINIGILVWFVPQIASAVTKWVPSKDGKARDTQRLRYISQKFVDLGELNIVEAEGAILKMSAHSQDMFKGFRKAFDNPATDLSSEISRLKKMEEEADLMMQDITEYLVQCSARDLTPQHAGNIAAMVRIVAELEEATDSIYRLIKLIERKYNKGHQFSDHQTKRVGEIADVVGQALSAVDNYLLKPVPAEVITSVKSLEDQTDNMRKKYNKESIKRMSEGDIRVEMLYTDINNQLEILANHVLNIMEASDSATHPRD